MVSGETRYLLMLIILSKEAPLYTNKKISNSVNPQLCKSPYTGYVWHMVDNETKYIYVFISQDKSQEYTGFTSHYATSAVHLELCVR